MYALAAQSEIVDCRRCPRLVEYREAIALEKVKRFRDWEYWGRPVPSFGSVEARLLLVGLAPAAHGGNRTGRVFTGDRQATGCTARFTTSGLPISRLQRIATTAFVSSTATSLPSFTAVRLTINLCLRKWRTAGLISSRNYSS